MTRTPLAILAALAVNLAVLASLPLAIAGLSLVRPWRRRPRRDQLALLVEREHPELCELFVSAVQFSERGAGADADPRLVERV